MPQAVHFMLSHKTSNLIITNRKPLTAKHDGKITPILLQHHLLDKLCHLFALLHHQIPGGTDTLELADESKKDSYVKRIIKWIVPERWSSCTDERLAKFAKITIPMRWVILQLFGGPLGVVERRDDEYKPDKRDSNDIPTLYIREKKLTYGAIMVLSMLIVTFGILTLSSAVNLSLVRITHVCSEDPNIYCYPQLIREANETIIRQFNIIIDISEPILDCAFWDSEGMSSQVTFACFRFVYNVEAFLATIGGLLTIFTITMKISTGVLLWLNESCNCCTGCFINGKHTARAILAVSVSLIEIALAVMCYMCMCLERRDF